MTRYEYTHVNKKARRHARSVWLCQQHANIPDVTHLVRMIVDPFGVADDLLGTVDLSEHVPCAFCTAEQSSFESAKKAHLDVALHSNGAIPEEHLAPAEPVATCNPGSQIRGVGIARCVP